MHYISTGWGLKNKTAPYCFEWEWFSSIQEWVKGENPQFKPNNFCPLFTKSLKCEWGREPGLLQSFALKVTLKENIFDILLEYFLLFYTHLSKKKPAWVFNSPCHDGKGQTPAVLLKPLGEAWLHLILINLESSSSKSLSLTLTCPGSGWLETGEVEKPSANLCPLKEYIIWQRPFQHVEQSGTCLSVSSKARLETCNFTFIFLYDFTKKMKVRANLTICWQYLGSLREVSAIHKSIWYVLWQRYNLTDITWIIYHIYILTNIYYMPISIIEICEY